MKYDTPKGESEILPNLLGLTSQEEIAVAELEGFLKSEITLSATLSPKTKFNLAYICSMHKLAFKHLYEFAGKYRTVNISKDGFLFAAAGFLPETMQAFEKEILDKLPHEYTEANSLIKDIATVHAELLFIHPFREGNGRTARLLANLMARKHGYDALHFERIDDEVYAAYVVAVQQAATRKYDKMEAVIRLVFPD